MAERLAGLGALLDAHWQETLRRSPELATVVGDARYNDRWTDSSPEAIAADLATDRAFLARFEAIDPAGFPAQDALSLELSLRALRQRLATARFETWLMPVTQFWGIHVDAPALIALTPFATARDYDDYVARLTRLPAAFDQAIALMRLGVTKHLVLPTSLIAQCVTQAERIAGTTALASEFARPLATLPPVIAAADRARIRAAVRGAIRTRVLPAYRAFAAFLRQSYLPHGRAEPGLWALPDGEARYAAQIAENTTTALGAEEIHALGLREVARIEAEQAAIGQALGFADLPAFKRHVRGNRALYAKSRADILARYRQFTDAMYAQLPRLFGHLPRQRMTIAAVEAFRERETSFAQYAQGTPDGTRAGVVLVNTYQPTRRLTTDIESTAYHEGVPGHHLQIALQQELGALPAFRQQAYYAAFQEGWALYAERLGKDVGLYRDPYSDYGRLQDEMLRAIRLVVDTGLHARRWRRAEVVQYFHDHSTIDEPTVQSETDRYIAIPGQALAYKVGQLTISRLRDEAQAALGPAFDLRAFHDEVLGAGALPLDVLERRIAAWRARP